ncbi:MAG: shikimate dehydrogenase, partial [Nitrospirae bacterium]
MEINAKTQLCGLLGNPVEHSLSPAIHNAAFEKLGLNFVYLAFRVEDI